MADVTSRAGAVIHDITKVREQAADMQKRLQTIQEQIARISRIMESLLNMARPSARRTRVPVSLPPLLDNTLAFLTERLTRRRVEVVRDYQETPSITADSEALQQVFLNLVMNAIDAMPEGGKLTVQARPAGEHVEVLIKDGPTLAITALGEGIQRAWYLSGSQFVCRTGSVSIDRSGVKTGDNAALGVASGALDVYPTGDKLVLNSHGGIVGVMLLVPVAAYSSGWARFSLIEAR